MEESFESLTDEPSVRKQNGKYFQQNISQQKYFLLKFPITVQ